MVSFFFYLFKCCAFFSSHFYYKSILLTLQNVYEDLTGNFQWNITTRGISFLVISILQCVKIYIVKVYKWSLSVKNKPITHHTQSPQHILGKIQQNQTLSLGRITFCGWGRTLKSLFLPKKKSLKYCLKSWCVCLYLLNQDFPWDCSK